jgi:DNA-binding MarR family transcriptional regulator
MMRGGNGRHTPEGAAVTELILSIFRANGRLLREGDVLTRDLDLTSARWQVMGAIVDRPKTAAQIAREFELSRQGVLLVVQSLLKSGHVELIDNPNHRRAKLVRLTKRGWKLHEELIRRQAVWVNDIGARFRVREVKQALKVIDRLGSVIKERHKAAAAVA